MRELLPPQSLIDLVGRGDFVAIGAEFLGHYTSVGALYPEAHVLDMGCGCGRMALPLSRYLTSGRYDGFDVVPDAIAWCREHIAPEFPNFQFERVDAYNSFYNPDGSVHAENYRFPYPDQTFDFAFASSLFTHLVWAETRNYLAEAKRVDPAAVVAYADDEVRELFAGAGLTIREIHLGRWPGRTIGLTTQDMIVAERP